MRTALGLVSDLSTVYINAETKCGAVIHRRVASHGKPCPCLVGTEQPNYGTSSGTIHRALTFLASPRSLDDMLDAAQIANVFFISSKIYEEFTVKIEPKSNEQDAFRK